MTFNCVVIILTDINDYKEIKIFSTLFYVVLGEVAIFLIGFKQWEGNA